MAYTGIAAHKLVVGVDAQWNTRVEQEYYEADSGNMILDTDDTSRTFGLYAQDEWRFHPQWLLNVGLRYDKHSDFDAVTSPRAALIWQPTQRLSLKGIVGSSYRTPNAYERFYNDGGDSQNASPDLQPEEVASVELAAGYRFGQNGRVGLSVYRNEITDLIDQVTDSSGVSTFINQDKVKARGVEVDAENRWVGGVRLRGSIAWQKSEKADGTGLVDSPKWLGKAVLCLPVAFGWTANGEIIGVSSRKGDNGRVPGYGIVNLSLLSAPAAVSGNSACRSTIWATRSITIRPATTWRTNRSNRMAGSSVCAGRCRSSDDENATFLPLPAYLRDRRPRRRAPGDGAGSCGAEAGAGSRAQGGDHFEHASLRRVADYRLNVGAGRSARRLLPGAESGRRRLAPT
jgi:hypothetical protein